MAGADDRDGARLARVVTWLRGPIGALQSIDWQAGGLATAAATLRSIDRRATSRAFEPFDALEQQLVEALVATMCATDTEDLASVDAPALAPVDAPELAQVIETYVLGLPLVHATNLRNLFVCWEYQPLLFGPRRALFTRLTDEERDANLGDWATAPQTARAAAFKALKTLCMLAYWSQPSAWPGIGYPGPTLPQESP